MNEVSKIHLGRQSFTIAVDAQKDLRAYLDALKKHMSDKDVVDEVELRMAELLTERGVTGDKVILPADIDFLKEQLGEPKDFEEAGEEPTPSVQPSETKRLFRDTDNAVIAGVSSGLAAYFGIDVWIIRIVFIIGVLSGGWGVLIYLILWLLVPEAKTPSDRLQMAGKPVTASSLKEAVERADVKGAAARANSTVAAGINNIFDILLKVTGIAVVALGISMLLGFIGSGGYLLMQDSNWLGHIFPIGIREHLLLGLSFGIVALLSVLVIVLGVAMFRRAWPLKAWATGTLLGLLLVSMVGTAVLGADAAPRIRDRYQANLHTTTRTLQPFAKIDQIGEGVEVNYEQASTYSVSMRYFDHPDLSTVKTSVSGDTLIIDSSQFDRHHNCSGLCVPELYNVTITVKSPNPPKEPIEPDEPITPPVPARAY
jgi:phage shock protein PspC (stress-responsive transcriptional regulator)